MKHVLVLAIFVLVQGSVLNFNRKNINVFPRFILKSLKFKADQIIEAAGGNTQCAKDLKKLINDAVFLKRWALEMFDASAKLPSGLLSGNIFMTGSFDQCLNVNAFKNETNIHGKYCTVLLNPTKEISDNADFFTIAALKDFLGIKTNLKTQEALRAIKMSFGLCIPETCSIETLQTLWNYAEKTFKLPVHIRFIDSMCSTKTKEISPFEIDKYIRIAFGLYIIILLLSTIYDVCIHQHLEGNQDSLLITFSLYTNVKKIITVKEPLKNDTYLHALSGIKVLNMLWIVYGHRVVSNFYSGVTNLIYTHSEWKHQLFTTFTFAAQLGVDTFLAFSGLLLSYGILNYYHLHGGRKKIPVLILYVYRIMRLSPALLAVILFYIAIYKNLTSGPIWPFVAGNSANSCHSIWFTTLFFFSNFVNINSQCMEQSWYLSVDTQLFIISPILLASLIRNPRKTCFFCIVLCILSGIYSFYLTIRYDYGALLLGSDKNYHYYIYQRTITRMPSWLIGFVFGYIIFKYRQLEISKAVNTVGLWSVFIINISLILVHQIFVREEYNIVYAALFNSCARQLWAFATVLLVFLCKTNQEGLINKFLSLPIFQRIVRLSYSVYLTHLAVLMYFIGGKKHSTYFTNIMNIHDFVGDLFFVFVVATIWCLAFESPFIAIASYFYKKEMAKTTYVALQENKKVQQKKRGKKKNKYLVCVYEYEENKEIVNKKAD